MSKLVGSRRRVVAVALALALLAPPSPAADDAGPRGQDELPTTSARIFWHNFDLDVEYLKAVVARAPEAVWAVARLAASYQLRGGYRGDLDEIQRGIELLDRGLGVRPEDPLLLLTRAKLRMSLHLFPQARQDLAAARRRLGPGAENYPLAAEIEQDLRWNLGEYQEAMALISASLRAGRTTATVLRAALMEAALGHHRRAEELFAEAEELVVDVDPLPVAWLDVQRGIHQLALGRPERAEPFFREARRRLPGYVLTEEHLAAALDRQGKDAEAVALYEALLERSADPELMGALAALYRRLGRLREADELAARAKRRFEELLAKYPEAMYWHAAKFFLTEGKAPARALDLLERNYALRPNLESLTALARAQLANGELTAARRSVEKALALPVVSPEIDELLRLPELRDLRLIE